MSRNENKSVNKNKKDKALLRRIVREDRVMRLKDRKEVEKEYDRLFKIYGKIRDDLESLIDDVGGLLDKYDLVYREE